MIMNMNIPPVPHSIKSNLPLTPGLKSDLPPAAPVGPSRSAGVHTDPEVPAIVGPAVQGLHRVLQQQHNVHIHKVQVIILKN